MKSGRLVHRKVRQAIQSLWEQKFGPQHFVIAVSGGTDSQCLLRAMSYAMKPLKGLHTMEAVGVHHGLREEADAELDLAESLAQSLGIPFTRIRVTVEKKGRDSLQSAARDARYAALRAHRPGSMIVTAHHFDDRAETVLIRMLRGDGVGAMGVMGLLGGAQGDVFRPMLEVEREEILAYLKWSKIPYASDPSNDRSDLYLRSFVRHEVLPLLKTRSPRITKKLNRIADDLCRHD